MAMPAWPRPSAGWHARRQVTYKAAEQMRKYTGDDRSQVSLRHEKGVTNMRIRKSQEKHCGVEA